MELLNGLYKLESDSFNITARRNTGNFDKDGNIVYQNLGHFTKLASAEEVMNAVTNQNNASSSKGNTSPQTNKKLSEAQLKRLYAISSAAGYTNEKLIASVRARYKCDVAELTKEQYDHICESLEKAKK